VFLSSTRTNGEETSGYPWTSVQKERFKVRTTVERANAHLKDWLVPAQQFIRGMKKVSFQLLCGVLCLAVLKILKYFILPAQMGK